MPTIATTIITAALIAFFLLVYLVIAAKSEEKHGRQKAKGGSVDRPRIDAKS